MARILEAILRHQQFRYKVVVREINPYAVATSVVLPVVLTTNGATARMLDFLTAVVLPASGTAAAVLVVQRGIVLPLAPVPFLGHHLPPLRQSSQRNKTAFDGSSALQSTHRFTDAG